MTNKNVVYIRTKDGIRIMGQPVQENEIENFVREQLSRGPITREETPYIWADFFHVPVQEVQTIIEKINGEKKP